MVSARVALGACVLVANAACGDNQDMCDTTDHATTGSPPPCSRSMADCTDVFVVAHPDDDLLFMNPDIRASIDAGREVVTIYVTASELGRPGDDRYWLDRERGIVNAYSYMLGDGSADAYMDASWLPAGWSVTGHGSQGAPSYVEYAHDAASGAHVSLIFLRLGDYQTQCLWEQTNGCSSENPYTPGTPYSAFAFGCVGTGESTMCNKAPLSREALVSTLGALLTERDATSINTLDSSNLHFDDLGHSDVGGFHEYWDHYYSGLFTLTAALRVELPGLESIGNYRGYTISREAANLDDADACAKSATFEHYAIFDAQIGVPSGAYRLYAPTSWPRRRYATRTLAPGASRLGNGARCVREDGDALAMGSCVDAPRFERFDARRVRIAGTDQCLAVAVSGGHITRPSPMCDGTPCEPVPPIYDPEPVLVVPCSSANGEAASFVFFANGQVRTANGRCLAVQGAELVSADCATDRAGDHVDDAPAAGQNWNVDPRASIGAS